MSGPFIIAGGVSADQRGMVGFCNAFDMTDIKRFYHVHHPDLSVVRAWQGHRIERKWFCVLKGRFLIASVQPDNWTIPSKNLPVDKFILNATSSDILHIPAGYANGVKALEKNSILLVFSDLSIDEAKGDMYRFDADLWFDFNTISNR